MPPSQTPSDRSGKHSGFESIGYQVERHTYAHGSPKQDVADNPGTGIGVHPDGNRSCHDGQLSTRRIGGIVAVKLSSTCYDVQPFPASSGALLCEYTLCRDESPASEHNG